MTDPSPQTGFQTVKPPKRRKQKDTPSRRAADAKRLTERIDGLARDRQSAWTQTGQSRLTEQLGDKLEVLYDEVRMEQAGEPGSPYFGKTTAVQRWENPNAQNDGSHRTKVASEKGARCPAPQQTVPQPSSAA